MSELYFTLHFGVYWRMPTPEVLEISTLEEGTLTDTGDEDMDIQWIYLTPATYIPCF